jgi:hypothetical protein
LDTNPVVTTITTTTTTTTTTTIHGQHHPKADVDRLYVPRKQGGRGLMELEAAHAVEITKLVKYVDRKETH